MESPRCSGRPRSASVTGSTPAQVPDFIALRGDPSDGIPGAKGIGEKTAARPPAPATATLDTRPRERATSGAPRGSAAPLRDGRDEIPTPYREMATLQDAGRHARPPDAPTDWRRRRPMPPERFGMNALAERLREMG